MSARWLLLTAFLRAAMSFRQSASKCVASECVVRVSFDGDKNFDFKFTQMASVADLRTGIDKYLESQGSNAPFPTWDLTVWTRVSPSTRLLALTDDEAKLAQLGLDGNEVRPVAHGVKGGVMGGKEANWDEYDFVCELYFTGSESGFASGFIWGNAVLTAAHNFAGRPQGFEEGLHVRTADKKWHTLIRRSDMRSIYIYRDYLNIRDGSLPAYGDKVDVAVAFLDGAGYMPKANVKLALHHLPAVGADIYLAGFGLSEKDAYKQNYPKQERPLHVGKFEYGGPSRRATHGNGAYGMTMLNYNSNADGCGGDSGAPWFMETTHWGRPKEFFVFGIHHGSTNCNPGRPTNMGESDFTLLTDQDAQNLWLMPFYPLTNGRRIPWPLES